MLMGTDPEFFLSDGEGGFKSASEVFGGKNEKWTPPKEFDKEKGRYTYVSGGHQAFRDGFAVELNVLPSSCRETLTSFVQGIMRDVETFVGLTHPKWRLVSKAAIPVDLAYINTLPEDVRMFGCDPAFSAWTEREERIELNGAVHPWRYAGGHMHFSTSIISKKETFPLIRLFDLLIGLPLSLIFNEKDEFQRRRFYGRAGEFRFQPWGIEYRVPSCRVWNHPMIASMAFGVGRVILSSIPTYQEVFNRLSKERKTFEEDLIKAINEGKGGEDLLQEVSFYYNKKIIDYVRGEGKNAFKLSSLTLQKVPARNGWKSSLYTENIYPDLIRAKEVFV